MKKINFILIITMFLLVLPLGYSQIAVNNLEECYSFDIDANGVMNRFPGTVSGATLVPGGQDGNYYAFDGSSSYIDFGSVILRDESRAGNGTIYIVFKINTTLGSTVGVGGREDGSNNNYPNLRRNPAAGTGDGFRFAWINAPQDDNTIDLTTATAFPVDEWRGVFITWNLTSSEMAINGTVNVTFNNPNTANLKMYAGANSFVVGKDPRTSPFWLQGGIAEMAIWNATLNDRNMSALFPNGKMANCTLIINGTPSAADTTPPEINFYNMTSEGGTGCTNWDANKSNPCATNDTTPTTFFRTNENALCAVGISDLNYSNLTNQQISARDISNNQFLGTFDWVARKGNKVWALNYISSGESHVAGTFNMTPVLYVLQMTNTTQQQVTLEVERMINATK